MCQYLHLVIAKQKVLLNYVMCLKRVVTSILFYTAQNSFKKQLSLGLNKTIDTNATGA